MAQVTSSGASPNAHLLVGRMPAPHQLHGPGWEGTGLSIAAHALVFAILTYAATHVPQAAQIASDVTGRFKVYLDRPGSGNGAKSGGGDPKPLDPARREQLTEVKPLQISPSAQPKDTQPAPEAIVPVITMQAQQMLPGAAVGLDTRSPGRGAGPGGGDGRGPGSGGPGDGPGAGPGILGGYGDSGSGKGANPPLLIKEVKPLYTIQAMRAKLQGAVEMEAVVLPNGSVDPASIRITRSLDSAFGLDEQAIIAVKQWRFRPGTFQGQPVAARVTVELTFTLR